MITTRPRPLDGLICPICRDPVDPYADDAAAWTADPTAVVHRECDPTYRWVVQTASASMPRTCWGRYGRVAVLELEPDWDGPVAMISARARGVRRVICTWERLNIGSTDRCAFARALAAADEMVAEHNARLAS